MKAISIKQPWASLIASGVKTRELRNWPTEHRGPLVICSSRRPIVDGHQHGMALCVVDVTGCRRMTPDDVPFACVGQFLPDHFAWELGNVRLIKPFGVVGQLRLFDVPDRLIWPTEPASSTGAEAVPPAYAAGRKTGRAPGTSPGRCSMGRP
jgi:hypothetical protein